MCSLVDWAEDASTLLEKSGRGGDDLSLSSDAVDDSGEPSCSGTTVAPPRNRIEEKVGSAKSDAVEARPLDNLAKRLQNLQLEQSGAFPNPKPISTPRRRLRDALRLEKDICLRLANSGWKLAYRGGKKVDGRYGLVSAYSKCPDVRVTLYQTQTSEVQELFFQYPADLMSHDQVCIFA